MAAKGNGHYRIRVTNKFGATVSTLANQVHCDLSVPAVTPKQTDEDLAAIARCVRAADAEGLFTHLLKRLPDMDFDAFRWFVDQWACQTAEQAPALGLAP